MGGGERCGVRLKLEVPFVHFPVRYVNDGPDDQDERKERESHDREDAAPVV